MNRQSDSFVSAEEIYLRMQLGDIEPSAVFALPSKSFGFGAISGAANRTLGANNLNMMTNPYWADRDVASSGYGHVGSFAVQIVPNAAHKGAFSSVGHYGAKAEGNGLAHRVLSKTDRRLALPMHDSPWSSTELCVITNAHIIDSLVESYSPKYNRTTSEDVYSVPMPVDNDKERHRLNKMMKLFNLSISDLHDVIDMLQSHAMANVINDKTLIISEAVVVGAKEYLRTKVDPWRFLTEKETVHNISRSTPSPRVPPGANINVEDVEYIPNVGDMLRVNRNGRTEFWDPKVLDNGGILSETTSDKLRAQEAAKRAEKVDIDAPKPKRAAAKAALASMSDIIEVETPKKGGRKRKTSTSKKTGTSRNSGPKSAKQNNKRAKTTSKANETPEMDEDDEDSTSGRVSASQTPETEKQPGAIDPSPTNSAGAEISDNEEAADAQSGSSTPVAPLDDVNRDHHDDVEQFDAFLRSLNAEPVLEANQNDDGQPPTPTQQIDQ